VFLVFGFFFEISFFSLNGIFLEKGEIFFIQAKEKENIREKKIIWASWIIFFFIRFR
jgi:hypothetical protein